MPVKVTVVVLTYNHERFISKALESILSQKTDFSFQILVADDGSTDGTTAIVDDFQKRYPDRFLVSTNEENQGIRNNVLKSFLSIKGEYTAILDGDDYWCDSEKLSKQVRFLDKNREFNGVFHDAHIVHVDSSEAVLFNHKKYYSQSYVFQEIITPTDLLSRKMILPSSSALLRTSAAQHVDLSLLNDKYSLLWKITCFAIKHSKFYFINEAMSVYHNHNKGISKTDNIQFHLSHIGFLKNLFKDNYYKYCQYDLYTAMSNEYKILLDQKATTLNKKKLYRKYVVNELKRLWYFRKTI